MANVCHCNMPVSNKGFSCNKQLNKNAEATALIKISRDDLVILFETTSNENNNPAIGLLNRAVIAAATPAQTNSVLYSFRKLNFLFPKEPIAADATTVDTSIPVEPPKITVKNPLK